MATPNKPPKTMSSRLLTMKFMQRATASPSSTPSTPSEPPSKKQRMSNGSARSTPSSTPRSDAERLEEALAAEEQKRAAALHREAADRGETKWVLSFQEPQGTESPLRIVSAGYATLDVGKPRSSEDDEVEERPQVTGRRSFGNFNRTVKVRGLAGACDQAYAGLQKQVPDAEEDEDDDDDDDDDDADESDDPTGAKAMISQSRRQAGEKAREERRAKRVAQVSDIQQLAGERRQKQVNLNRLTSISGGGGSSGGRGDFTCHLCGKKGHVKRDCLQESQQRPRHH